MPGKPAAHFAVGMLEATDVKEFLELQDLFAEEHLALTRGVYEKVGLRDWQLCLLCPAHILEADGGREAHIAAMVRREEECFQRLSILKATGQVNGGPVTTAGYIMYQTHEGEGPAKRRKRPRGGNSSSSPPEPPSGPFVQVKQFFVRKPLRGLGCGRLLFSSMLKAVPSAQSQDIRLSVVDLNTPATKWYRREGFVVVNLSRELIGQRDEANVIVYQEMRRVKGIPQNQLAVPLLFRREVMYEVIRITYPDNSGAFDVKVVGYNEKERWHFIDSRGLSLWEGESFTDTVNLNEFFRDGHVQFKRPLSLVQRDAYLTLRESRKAKMMQNSKRDDSPDEASSGLRPFRRVRAGSPRS